MKFEQLKLEQLKKELSKRNLPTTGLKAQLQVKLRSALETDEIDLETFEFDYDAPDLALADEEPEHPMPTFDVNQLNAALEKLSVSLEAKFSHSVGGIQQCIDERIQTMSSNINCKVIDLENRVKEMEGAMNSRMENIEKHFLGADISADLETSRVQTSRVDPDVALRNSSTSALVKLKPPTFNGTTSFDVFKMQFETVIQTNGWNNGDSVAALIVSLQGGASEILQTVSISERKDYSSLMDALQRKYGNTHMKQIYRIELKNRKQTKEESLSDFATEVERLAYLAYSDTSPDFMEKCKIDVFVDGIRDVDTKRATVTTPKATFCETVTTALTHETASLVCRSDVTVRCMEKTEDKELLELICHAVKSFKRSDQPDRPAFYGKCYYCDKVGHLARDCFKRKSEQFRSKSPEAKYRKKEVQREEENRGRIYPKN